MSLPQKQTRPRVGDEECVHRPVLALSALELAVERAVLGRPAAGVDVALTSQSSARLMEEPTPLSCRYTPWERRWWLRLEDMSRELEKECWGKRN